MPSQIEGLSITADMYDIEITNLISSIGGQLILNGCYLGTDPSYCQLIDRLPAGNISDLRNTTNNVGTVSTSGVEAAAVYDFSTDMGEFSVSADARWLDTLESVLANGDSVNSAGYVLGSSRSNNVDFKTNLALQWSNNNMFGSLTYQYFGEGKGIANQGPTVSAAGVAAPLEAVTKIDAIGYLDAQFGMVVDKYNATVRVGIDNILDEDPTLFVESFANDFDPAYRTWGSMSWYANVTVKF